MLASEAVERRSFPMVTDILVATADDWLSLQMFSGWSHHLFKKKKAKLGWKSFSHSDEPVLAR